MAHSCSLVPTEHTKNPSKEERDFGRKIGGFLASSSKSVKEKEASRKRDELANDIFTLHLKEKICQFNPQEMSYVF